MARTHFTRIIKRNQVNELVDLLSEAADKTFPKVAPGQETFKYKAPDGDEVFTGLRHPNGLYICRMHKEVFSEK